MDNRWVIKKDGWIYSCMDEWVVERVLRENVGRCRMSEREGGGGAGFLDEQIVIAC